MLRKECDSYVIQFAERISHTTVLSDSDLSVKST